MAEDSATLEDNESTWPTPLHKKLGIKTSTLDGFQIDPDHLFFEEHLVINQLLINGILNPSANESIKMPPAPSYRKFAMALWERYCWTFEMENEASETKNDDRLELAITLRKIVEKPTTKNLKSQYGGLKNNDLLEILQWVNERTDVSARIVSSIIKAAKQTAKFKAPSLEVKLGLEQLLLKIQHPKYKSLHKPIQTIEKLQQFKMVIKPGDPWTDAALAEIALLPVIKRDAWNRLLEYCDSAFTSKPGKNWFEKASICLDNVERNIFKKFILSWFPLADDPSLPMTENGSQELSTSVIERHGDILVGLIWCCSLEEDREIAQALKRLATSTYKKHSPWKPFVKIGNACVFSLGQMPGIAGVVQLELLKSSVRKKNPQKTIEKAMLVVAERVQLPLLELEELSVPSYSFTEGGKRCVQFGDFKAELSITATSKVELKWIKEDGKSQKSVPKSVKETYGEDLKDLKADAREIPKMLSAQSHRIERLFSTKKTWEFATWKERYLDHPLVGMLTRRIIWNFTTGQTSEAGFWWNGQFVNSQNQTIQTIGDTIVSLWHPIDQKTASIVAWRNWLEEQQVTQPFKQVHREIYLLTEAERKTRTYSNRFAAHVLKQHQLKALADTRGWNFSLQGNWSKPQSTPGLDLTEWGLRAEFWVDGISDGGNLETSSAGAFLYVSTDQVRFYKSSEKSKDRTGITHPMYIDNVPPLVLSEVLRDVDLFIGVASIGNDPMWSESGSNRHQNYWKSYSFGKLNTTAVTRREILEKLIPKLKIADRCTLTDRFLTVKGNIRSYKIHLGSSNILMEPDDQYLCIVANRDKNFREKSILPFEGDMMLSLVLSKAFLLSEDSKIKDPTILSQIKS